MTCHSWIHGTCVNYNGGSVKSKGGQKQMDTSKEQKIKNGSKGHCVGKNYNHDHAR